MSDKRGIQGSCPNCDCTGLVGQPCTERACKKRGYHIIPTEHAARAADSDAGDPYIGRCIADYLCVDTVGMGGFGKVYLAYQLPILMKTALKLMERTKFERGVMQMMLKQFEGEAAALAALNHPNIVRLLKYGTHNDTPYLVMEYVSQAVTLKREISNRAVRGAEFKPEDVQHVLTQTLAGLQAAHAMEIVHRDIKPDNIMLQELPGHSLFVRILDFGMAKFVEEQQDTKFAMGTPAYMAPEQLTRKGIGPWTDLYAVGVMAFELISGRRPFIGRSHQELLTKKIDPSFDPLTRLKGLPLPEMVRSFLGRALAFSPNDRFREVATFRDAMNAAFNALKQVPTESSISVELSEIAESSRGLHISEQRQKLKAERAALEAERRRLEQERQRLRSATRQSVTTQTGPPRPLPTEGLEANYAKETARKPLALKQELEKAERENDWPRTIHLRESLLAQSDSPMERFMLQMQIGDTYRTRLLQPSQATSAYTKALKFGTFSKAPLLHLVQLHVEAKNYPEAIKALKQLIDHEKAPKKKAVYAMSVGVLFRDGLKDVDQSVRFLNLALDYDPAKVKAIVAIEEQLRTHERWPMLAKCYELMILRVKKHGAQYDNANTVLVSVYRKLGKLLLNELDEIELATEAFEAAYRLRPRDGQLRDQLLVLYEEQGLLEKTAEQYRLRLKAHQDDFDSYSALVRLYDQLGQPDRAWLVAGLLRAFGKSNPEETQYYDTYIVEPEPNGPPLTEQQWSQLVVGPPEAPRLGKAFGIIFQALGPNLETHTAKDFGLRRRDRAPTRGSFGSVLSRVCQQLAIAAPDVYLDAEMSGVQVLPIMPPALKVGPDVLAMTSTSELAFLLGKFVTLLHPWHIMGALFDEEQLELVLLAARSLASPEGTLWLPPDLPAQSKQAYKEQVTFLRSELDRSLDPLARVQLSRLVPGLLDLPELPDIDAWRRLVEMTANHAGCVVCNDVALSARMLRQEQPNRSLLNADEKMRDLVLWVLSNRYRGVREFLGLELQPG